MKDKEHTKEQCLPKPQSPLSKGQPPSLREVSTQLTEGVVAVATEGLPTAEISPHPQASQSPLSKGDVATATGGLPPRPQKQRLDTLLVELGLAESRERAKAIIMAGIVYVDNQKCDKAGQAFKADQNIEVRGDSLKYVSRGGLKLEKAMKEFNIELNNKTAMDVGASTGGFTDCMLQNGAAKVYCVDVGYGQLAWKLRSDPRVVVMERTNIRYVKAEEVEPLDFATVDTSFISLKLVLPVVFTLLKDGGEVVALIKPQFEAGREKVGKKGVVRDKSVHLEVVQAILAFAPSIGLAPVGLTFSPIKGPEGNIEYLVHLVKGGTATVSETDAVDVVDGSHEKNMRLHC